MGTIISIIGAMAGLSGMVFGIIGFFHYRMTAVTTFLEYTREPDFIEARNIILGLSAYDSQSLIEDRERATKIESIISTYNMLGLLVKKHQLPKWFFQQTSTGDNAIKFYEQLEPYILYHRDRDGIGSYANQFEYLYRLMKKRRR